MTNKPQVRTLQIVALVVVIAAAGYFLLNAPDRRTDAQKVGDAISELPNGTDKAVRQLESRTPGEKLEDAAQDMRDDVNNSTNN